MYKIKSPNFTHVKQRNINMVILHHTEMISSDSALKRMCDPEAIVSAHYLIDKYDGSVTQLVEDRLIAHHAGESFWQGQDSLNNFSIGIELDNDGREEFSDILMDSLLELLKDLVEKHGISSERILGHLDVAPWRKLDPHHKFDWKLLSEHGFGLYPTVKSDDFGKSQQDPSDRLSRLGYDIRDLNAAIIAFNTHFNPKSYDNNCIDVWTNSSNIYLDNLLAQEQ